MKKWMITLSLALVVVAGAVGYGLYQIMPERNRVQFNPFTAEHYSYVKIDNSHLPANTPEDGAVEYTLPAWNENGTMQNITFTGIKKLRSGAYIKLISKGGYVITYEEVQPDELPAAVREHLVTSAAENQSAAR